MTIYGSRTKGFGTRAGSLISGAATFAVFAGLAAGTAHAQVGAGSISGVVEDPSGAVIPYATVVLKNTGSGQERVGKSNGSGAFSFSAVAVGDYSVSAGHTGFEQSIQSGVHVNAGDALALQPLKLQVGAESTTVTVEGGATAIPLDSGQLSSTITANDLDRLSVVGRDATELQRILPGFAIRSQDSTNTAPDFSQVTIGQPTPYASNGAPVAGITLKLDGASLTDPGNFGANLQNINDDFVSEVQVQTSNFGADQSNGPVLITGVTKAGTQNYHGSLFTYARTYQLNSDDSLAKANGIGRPNDRFIYPGGTIGGPIPHSKKLTFFAGAEFDAQKNVYAYNSAQAAILHALVPTAAMRQGDFSAAALANYLGPNYTSASYAQIAPTPTVGDDGSALANGNISSFIDPGAIALVNGTLPLPNIAGGTNAQGYNYQAENLVDNNIFQTTGRVDYAISPKNLFFARYSFEKGSEGQPQIPYYSPTVSSILGAVNTPGGGLLNNIDVHSGAANYVTVFTPTLTNELYGTLTYFSQNFVPKNESALLKSTINYPYNGIFDNGSKQYPQLGTYAEYGGLPLGLWPDFSLGPLFLHKFQPNAGDNLTKVVRTHTLKFGVFGERVGNNQSITNGSSNGAIQNYYFGGAGSEFNTYGGTYPDGSPAYGPAHFQSGNTLANFFEGHVQDYHQQSILPRTDVYFWNVEGYAQDTWRVQSNVSVTFGLRVSHLGAWTDSHGVGAAIFNPAAIASTQNANTNPYPGFQWHGIDSSVVNSGTGSTGAFFEPRAGFAWDVFKTGRTVVRGGVGVYRFHDAETDVNGAFLTASGLKTADFQGFGGTNLAGIDSVHQNPTTFGEAGGTQASSVPIASLTGLDPTDHTDPVTNNYSLSIAQQLPRNTIVQVSYVGNNSNSLMNNGTTQAVVLNNVNALPVGALFTPAAAAAIDAKAPGACDPTGCTPLQAQHLDNLYNYPGDDSIQLARPYPMYGSVVVPRHNTSANYNALQVVYIKQTGHLNFNINYTFSKALGILGSAADFNFTAPIDPFNIQNNYAPLNFDRTQVLNTSYSYQFGKLVQQHLLGGFVNNWLVSGITNVQSGGDLQTGVSFSPDFNLQGTINNGANSLNVGNQALLGTPDVSLQPVLTCNPKSGLARNQYINGACFALPAIGTNGRNVFPYVHGPKFFNSDITLEKGFGIGGERKLRVRYAAFNFLNHPLHSFGTNASQATLNLSDTSASGTTGTAVYNPASGFGFAPLTIGRRLSEVSLKFDF